MTMRALHNVKATLDHADAAWAVLSHAKHAMREAGRSQWQGDYPSAAEVSRDIDAGVARVLMCDGIVVGYCALITTGDKCYGHIADGSWLTPDGTRYAVVHRLAIDPAMGGRGLASQWMAMLIDEARGLNCLSMRIDTNHDNVQMLRLLPRNGFAYCGKVWQSGGERMAFERVISSSHI